MLSTATCTLNIKLDAGHEYEVLIHIVYCHPCQFINQVIVIVIVIVIIALRHVYRFTGYIGSNSYSSYNV